MGIIVVSGLNQKFVRDAHSMFNGSTLHCKRCGHSWLPRTDNPQKCPKCGSYRWNVPKGETIRHVMVSETSSILDVDTLVKKILNEETTQQ